MVYSGTVVVAGKIEAIVVETGMDTEIGKIAATIDVSEEPITPLQVKVKDFDVYLRYCSILSCLCIMLWRYHGLYSFKCCNALYFYDCC